VACSICRVFPRFSTFSHAYFRSVTEGKILPACRARVLRLAGQDCRARVLRLRVSGEGWRLRGRLRVSEEEWRLRGAVKGIRPGTAARLAAEDPPRLPGESSQARWPRDEVGWEPRPSVASKPNDLAGKRRGSRSRSTLGNRNKNGIKPMGFDKDKLNTPGQTPFLTESSAG